jgi:hypothetical protein
MIPLAPNVAIRSERRPNATAVRGAVNASATSKWVRSLHRILRHEKRECKKSTELSLHVLHCDRCAGTNQMRGTYTFCQHRWRQSAAPCPPSNADSTLDPEVCIRLNLIYDKERTCRPQQMQMNTESGQDAFQDAQHTLLNPCEVCSLEFLDHAVPSTGKYDTPVERCQRTGSTAPDLCIVDQRQNQRARVSTMQPHRREKNRKPGAH